MAVVGLAALFQFVPSQRIIVGTSPNELPTAYPLLASTMATERRRAVVGLVQFVRVGSAFAIGRLTESAVNAITTVKLAFETKLRT